MHCSRGIHYTPPMPAQLQRTIGFWGAIAVMIGVIIGSGIFKQPPSIAAQFGSPWLILGLWIAGGLLCLAGAFTYGELAAMYPDSGGVYVFIREGYGHCAAFVFGWAYLVLVKPFAAGGIAFIFGEHVNIIATVIGRAWFDPTFTANWDVRISTTVMLLSLTAINIRGVALSTAFAGVLTVLKFGALAAIVLFTLALGKVDFANLAPAATPSQPDVFKALTVVFAGILWTYDGWADVGSIAGEVREPQRRLPRIYIGGTLAVIAIYVLVNAAYFMLVPIDEMRARAAADGNFSVAPLVMQRLIGDAGGVAVVLIVLFSTLGSSHASIMTGARVSYAQARDGLLFRFIGHVHPRWATPDAALITQVLLSVVAVWFLGSFQALADGFVFTMWIFYAMAGGAIFILRMRRPNATRPFRCPGYPVVPALFVLSALAMTGLSIYADRDSSFLNTLPWIGVLLAGAPVFYLWKWLTGVAATPTSTR